MKMGARAQLAWLIRGGPSTRAGLESLAVDLRELQQKVVGIEASMAELRRELNRSGERHLDDIDAIRSSVAAATDDLVARVNAIDERTRTST